MKMNFLLFSLLISVSLHLVAAIFFAEQKLTADPSSYNHTAIEFAKKNILIEPLPTLDSDGKAFVDEDVPFSEGGMGFPLFLGVIYKIFGVDGGGEKAALLLQALILGVTVPVSIYLILTRILIVSPGVLKMSMVLAAFWPTGPDISSFLLTESLATSMFTIFMCTVFFAFKKQDQITSAQFAIMAASALALFFIRYEFSLVIVALLVMIAAFMKLNSIGGWKSLAWSALAIGMFFTIPTIRNYTIFHRFVPLSTSGGKVLWLAATCRSEFGFKGEYFEVYKKAFVRNDSDLTNSNLGIEAKKLIKSDPKTYLKCSLERLIRTLSSAFHEASWNDAGAGMRILKIYKRLFKIFIVLGFLISLPLLYKRNPWIAVASFAPFAYKYLFIHTFMFGESRFFVVFEPLALCLTCFAISRWCNFLKGSKNSLQWNFWFTK